MNTILQALVNGFLLSVPIAVVTWFSLRFSRRFVNAATRYGVWWIALLVSTALPALVLPIKLQPKPAQAQPEIQKNDVSLDSHLTTSDSELHGALVTRPVLPVTDVRVTPRQSVSVEHPTLPILRIPVRLPSGVLATRISKLLAELWTFVSLLLFVRLGVSFAVLWFRKKNAEEAPLELQESMDRSLAACGVLRKVRIGVVKAGDSPMVAGPFRPCVLIPDKMLSALDAAEMEQICVHEAAHLARYDDWSLVLQRAIEAVFFFHPLVRWIARQIDLEREIACDDFVISVTGQPRPYASCLAHVAELAVGYSNSPLSSAVVDESSHLARRINTLLDKTRCTGTRILKVQFIAAVLVLVLFTWLAASSPALVAIAAQLPISRTVLVSKPITAFDSNAGLAIGTENDNLKGVGDSVNKGMPLISGSGTSSTAPTDIHVQSGADPAVAELSAVNESAIQPQGGSDTAAPKMSTFLRFGDPGFDASLDANFPGLRTLKGFQVLEPLLVILHVESGQGVKAFTIEWTITHMDGTIRKCDFSSLGEFIRPGGQQIMVEAGGTELISPYFHWSAAKYPTMGKKVALILVPNFAQYSFASEVGTAQKIEVQADGIVYDGGAFEGPDHGKLNELYKAEQIGAWDQVKAIHGSLPPCVGPGSGVGTNAQGHPALDELYTKIVHSGSSATLTVVENNRILLQGLTAVREEYGWKVDLEEAPYGGMPNPSLGTFVSTYPEDPKQYVARHGRNMPPSVTYLLSNDAEAGVLNKIVSDYNMAGFPGKYTVIAQADGSYAVVGTSKQNADGTSQTMSPILDTPISIPTGTRSLSEALDLITKALSEASGQKIVQIFPSWGGMMVNPQVTVGGDNIPARLLLQQALPQGAGWGLYCNYVDGGYGFNVELVRAVQYDMFGRRF